MTPRDFFELVAKMRQAQKAYFKTRTASNLQRSKELEKAVDAEIERVRDIQNDIQNPKLF